MSGTSTIVEILMENPIYSSPHIVESMIFVMMVVITYFRIVFTKPLEAGRFFLIVKQYSFEVRLFSNRDWSFPIHLAFGD
jgi:hypothetical protein